VEVGSLTDTEGAVLVTVGPVQAVIKLATTVPIKIAKLHLAQKRNIAITRKLQLRLLDFITI
jgi:hypothetical protein